MGDGRTYSEKLRDPRWQKVRLKVFERDSWACTACGDNANTLHVHHKLYEAGKEPWDYSQEYLLTLCERCHNKEYNDRSQIERRLLTELKRAGYLVGDLNNLTEEAIALRAGDFQRALLAFLTSFDLVFDNDWEFSRQRLQSDELGMYIRNGQSFLNPGIEDESNNWGNRGSLLASYRRLLAVMQHMGLRTDCFPDDW